MPNEIDREIARVQHDINVAAHHTDLHADPSKLYANVVRDLRDDLTVLSSKDSSKVLSAALTSMVHSGLLFIPSTFNFDTSKVKATVEQDKILLTDKSGSETITISEGSIGPNLTQIGKEQLHRKGMHHPSLGQISDTYKEIRDKNKGASLATVNLPDLTVESHVPLNVIADDLVKKRGIAKPTPAQIDTEVKQLQNKKP
jgi:hypothetical protein